MRRLARESAPDGRISSIAPNTDAPLATTRTDGTTANATFNTLGEQTSQSGAGQLAANFGYNQTTGQLGSITTFASGTLNSGPGATTSFHFDPNTGLPTATIYADNSQQDESYNSSGQLTNVQSVDPAGHYTSSGVFGYNTDDEQTTATYTDYLPGGSNVTDGTGSFDDMGRAGITTETAQNPEDPTGASTVTTTSTQAFNTTGDLASDTSGPSGASTVYGYYPTSGTGSTGGGASPGAMRSVKLVTNGTTLSETDYGYDPVSGRMSTITIVGQNGAANQVFNVAYKSGTDLISGITAPGSTTTYGYNPQNGDLTSLGTAKTGGASVYSGSYAYNDDDQRETDTVSRTNADGTADAYQATYDYDDRGELSNVSTTGSGGPSNGIWNYDGVGNRTNFAGTPNNLNQYGNYTYNARGDCTSDGVWNYSYDALDRLTGAVAVNGSAKVTFGYDAESRLTETDTWAPNGSGGWTLASTVRNAWDGSNLIAQFDGNNTLLRSFAYGPTGLLGITDYTSGSPVTYVPVMDATGSIVQLLDTSGNVVADFHYDAWGVRTAAGPAAGACPFGFAGMLQDATTGLYYDNARWYSAPQGRFLTRDPSGESGGLNLYAYCGNDPVNESDATGLDPAMSNADGPQAVRRFLLGNTAAAIPRAATPTIINYGFCSVCHGSADGKWVDLASGLDSRPIPSEQLQGILTANATSKDLSPYAEGGVKIVQSGLEVAGAVALAPFTFGTSLGLAWFAADDFTTGVRDIVDHESYKSITHDAIYNYAYAAGASDETADAIGTYGDLGLRLGNAGQGLYASWSASTSLTEFSGLSNSEIAAQLQARAEALALTRPWGDRLTVAVRLLRNVETGDTFVGVSTELNGVPTAWKANWPLTENEAYIVAPGHGELTGPVRETWTVVGGDLEVQPAKWEIVAGGVNTNICNVCDKELGSLGLEVGGPEYEARNWCVPYKQFWSPDTLGPDTPLGPDMAGAAAGAVGLAAGAAREALDPANFHL